MITQEGSIHLSRKIVDSDVWRMSPTRLKVWLLLLLRASPIKTITRVMGANFNLKPGELVDVEQVLADQSGLGLQTFRTAVKDLADDEDRILIKRGLKKGRIRIRILNYELYQTPCIAPEQPDEEDLAKTASQKRAVRKGALEWTDENRAQAQIRSRRTSHIVGELRDRIDITNARKYRLAASSAWKGSDILAWLGLYDLKYEQIFGTRSSEILAAKKRDLTAYRSRIGRMLKVLRAWAERDDDSNAEGMLFDYIRWRMYQEKIKNERVKGFGGRKRIPISLDSCFDPKALDRWMVSITQTGTI